MPAEVHSCEQNLLLVKYPTGQIVAVEVPRIKGCTRGEYFQELQIGMLLHHVVLLERSSKTQKYGVAVTDGLLEIAQNLTKHGSTKGLV